MGLERFIKHLVVPGSYISDMINNIKEEYDFIDGVKRTIKEDLTEDNPFTSAIYKSGKYDGKKQGYAEASDEYEKKLLEQAYEFLKQTKIHEKERDAYEALLDAYDAEIDMLKEKGNKTETDKEYLQQLLLRDRNLRKMLGA